MATFNEILRAARVEAGISQCELARRMGVHQSGVVRLERGDHTVSETTLRKAAEAMGLEVELTLRPIGKAAANPAKAEPKAAKAEPKAAAKPAKAAGKGRKAKAG